MSHTVREGRENMTDFTVMSPYCPSTKSGTEFQIKDCGQEGDVPESLYKVPAVPGGGGG